MRTRRRPRRSSPARPRPPRPKRSTTASSAASRPSAPSRKTSEPRGDPMSTDRPEFRPIETAPARRAWPYAVLGVAVVAAGLWFLQRHMAGAELPRVALGHVAPKIDTTAAAG